MAKWIHVQDIYQNPLSINVDHISMVRIVKRVQVVNTPPGPDYTVISVVGEDEPVYTYEGYQEVMTKIKNPA